MYLDHQLLCANIYKTIQELEGEYKKYKEAEDLCKEAWGTEERHEDEIKYWGLSTGIKEGIDRLRENLKSSIVREEDETCELGKENETSTNNKEV